MRMRFGGKPNPNTLLHVFPVYYIIYKTGVWQKPKKQNFFRIFVTFCPAQTLYIIEGFERSFIKHTFVLFKENYTMKKAVVVLLSMLMVFSLFLVHVF